MPLLSLVEFRASGNALSGTIPSIWPYPLEILDLSYNKFDGHINFKYADRWLELYLQGNALSGTFPDEIVRMKELRVLKMSDNNFTGLLPSGLGNLASLEVSHILVAKKSDQVVLPSFMSFIVCSVCFRPSVLDT